MRVLIADDEPVSRRLLEASLRRWGYEVIVAEDGLEAFEILQGPDAPKMAILDWVMPGMDGVELCREIRRQSHDAYTYVLLVTTKRDRRDVIEGLENGADDYLTKPFNPHELKVRMKTGKRILDLMDQLVQARLALRDQASRDGLTGLWNRSTILEKLDAELERSRRHEEALGIVMLDLDHFKAVNDIYGHLAGDEALRAAAEAIRSTIRPYDFAGRYGGEEFLIVLPGCDHRNTVSHAARMRAAISRLCLSDQEIRFTASFGAAVRAPDAAADSLDLLRAADEALYRAKREGRNCVVCARADSIERNPAPIVA